MARSGFLAAICSIASCAGPQRAGPQDGPPSFYALTETRRPFGEARLLALFNRELLVFPRPDGEPVYCQVPAGDSVRKLIGAVAAGSRLRDTYRPSTPGTYDGGSLQLHFPGSRLELISIAGALDNGPSTLGFPFGFPFVPMHEELGEFLQAVREARGGPCAPWVPARCLVDFTWVRAAGSNDTACVWPQPVARIFPKLRGGYLPPAFGVAWPPERSWDELQRFRRECRGRVRIGDDLFDLAAYPAFDGLERVLGVAEGERRRQVILGPGLGLIPVGPASPDSASGPVPAPVAVEAAGAFLEAARTIPRGTTEDEIRRRLGPPYGVRDRARKESNEVIARTIRYRVRLGEADPGRIGEIEFWVSRQRGLVSTRFDLYDPGPAGQVYQASISRVAGVLVRREPRGAMNGDVAPSPVVRGPCDQVVSVPQPTSELLAALGLLESVGPAGEMGPPQWNIILLDRRGREFTTIAGHAEATVLEGTVLARDAALRAWVNEKLSCRE